MREDHRLIAGKHRCCRRLKRSLQLGIEERAVDEHEFDFDRRLSIFQADVLKELLHVARAIQRAAQDIDGILEINANAPESTAAAGAFVGQRATRVTYQHESMKSLACFSERKYRIFRTTVTMSTGFGVTGARATPPVSSPSSSGST